ncbi:MFS transporter [Pseudonocardia sp. C8]|nr:MFS transporter [Pseudonocardia sp. C8]
MAIGVVSCCGLLVALLQTMVVPLVPVVPALLAVSPSSASWIITATLVAGAVSAPVLGRLGDMYGKRRMLLVSVWLVLASSVLAALAPNFAVLLVARALQGVSFGVIALGMSLMRDVLPAGRVGSGVGLMSSSLGVGGAAGPPLAGLVAEHASWRLLFAAVAAGALALVVLVPRLVPESRVRTGGRFDTVGALALGVALVLLLLGISKGGEWGWASTATLGSLGAAAVVLVLWGRYELRSGSPLVDLRVSARPAVLWTNVATVLLGFAIFATLVMATQILQAPVGTGYGFGLSMTDAGLVMLPLGGSMVVFSSVSARISRSRGPRTTVVLGAALLVLGNAGFATLPGSVWLVMVTATVSATGAALAYSALPLLIMRAVPETETAAANSMNTLMRQLGTSMVAAVAAAVAASLTMEVDGHLVPTGAAFTVSYLAAAGAALAGLVIAALTPAPGADRA